ncbi:MAG: glutamate racemase [Saprospiraceae bacterium]|nr:glutamate racemase [Saprospiraceae bacterium]MBK7810282.1 glutamate racemase [Saprospiraceae bacterium]MBK9629885.1 glutamate racemase [Saprospiraceae bacterium]
MEFNRGDLRPIGIFDSGIGGLTVAQAIHRILPQEKFIYIGDTAHLPYGDKSIGLIRQYAVQIGKYLIEQRDCKALVIACNTASAAAYEHLRDELKGIIPVINVIDPMVEYLISQEHIHRPGIIATKTTIQSGVYQEKLKRRKPELQYSVLATPLLAPMIEEGFYNDSISHVVLEEYLSDPVLSKIDSLVLACTHYPLIKKEIEEYYHYKIPIIDSAVVVADKLKFILEKENLLCQVNNSYENEFLVTDFSLHFENTTRLFYGESVKLEMLNF